MTLVLREQNQLNDRHCTKKVPTKTLHTVTFFQCCVHALNLGTDGVPKFDKKIAFLQWYLMVAVIVAGIDGIPLTDSQSCVSLASRRTRFKDRQCKSWL